MIQLDVDTKTNYTVGPNEVHGTSDKESIYLGGMPGEWVKELEHSEESIKWTYPDY